MEDLTLMLKEYNELFEAINTKLFSQDYAWPETSDDTFKYDLPHDFSSDDLKAFCDTITITEDAWTNEGLYEYLLKMFLTRRYYFDCGGITAIVAAIIYIQHYGKILECCIDFTHDKWEARGDYCQPKRVGIQLKNNKIKIVNVKYEAYDM